MMNRAAPPTDTFTVATSPSLASLTRMISISSGFHLRGRLYATGKHFQKRAPVPLLGPGPVCRSQRGRGTHAAGLRPDHRSAVTASANPLGAQPGIAGAY